MSVLFDLQAHKSIFSSTSPNYRNDPVILTDAKARLDKICSNQFLAIAKELHNQDTYQFARAYSPGLQEFIEAYTFYEYIKNHTVPDWNDMQKFLTYEEKAPETNAPEEESQSNTEEMPSIQYTCLIQPIEFMLGVADLSGEVMRRCINSLNSACIDNCFQSSNFLQDLYKGFIGIGQTRNRDMSQKIYTMKQSVLKTEMVCYNIKVRGTEAAKWGGEENKADAVDDDEGFY